MDGDGDPTADGSGVGARLTAGATGPWWVGRYRRDPGSGILHPLSDGPTFTYSDGDEVEQRLARIVGSTSDLSVLSVELVGQITDWPSLYHLSPRRANLLRPIETSLGGRILEVGAGCGAITRFLGELGAEIVALEPSRRRAAVAAARCRDLPNVQVVCDRFESADLPAGFDTVTLIGVLEYARLYSGGANPVQAMLERARALVSPAGHLVVAIENQLGLKYFGGYAEDHLDALMYGINDLYEEGSVVTFGRSELESRLRQAGFATVSVHVPLPDYKLPTTIVMEAGTDESALTECVASLAASSPIADGQRPVFPLFSIERAWRVVCRNGLLTELANSFLMVASPEPPGGPAEDGALLAVHCGGWRRPEFLKTTEIRRRQGDIHVTRRLLRPELEGRIVDTPLVLRLVEEPFRRGELWVERLTYIVNRQGWTLEPVVAWAQVWLDRLVQEAGVTGADPRATVPGRCFDATPFNLIRGPDGAFHFVDLEWELEEPLELGWVVFRGLYASFAGLSSVAEPEASVSRRIVDLVARVAEGLGLALDAAALDGYSRSEVQLQRWVAGLAERPRLEEYVGSQLAVRPGLASVEPLRARHVQLEAEVARREAEAARAGAELARVEAEVARVGAELRSASDRLQERAEEVAWLLEACAARDASIADLASRLDDTRRRSALERSTAARAAAGLAARVADRDREIASARRPAPTRGALALAGLLSREARPRAVGFLRALRLALHRSRRDEIERVLASGLFDEAYYARHVPGAGREVGSPLLHYVTRGVGERRAPSALLDVDHFDRHCDPPLRPGEDPVLRYLAQPPGRQSDPHPLFSVAHFLSRVGASAAAQANPVAHFLAGHGIVSPHPLFDPAFYLATNPDVAAADLDPLAHFVEFGAAEGRDPHPLFDTSYYVASNPDVAGAGENPLVHYLEFGADEGRDPHPAFDSSYYLESNPDVAEAGLNPLVHYLGFGVDEGRDPHPLFDTAYYLASNPDVAASGVNPLVHFVRHGALEGRSPRPDTRPELLLATDG